MAAPGNPPADSRFAELESSSATPAVVGHLRRLVYEGDDFDCYKINAFRASDLADASRLDGVRTLLFATRLGITDLTWDIHCPSCLGLPTYHRHLMELQRRAQVK